MRKVLLFITAVLFCVPSFAEELPITSPIAITDGVHLKQGFIVPWDNVESGFSNMTTATVLQTDAYEPFGKWNALWEGWSLDAAWSYDANTSNFGILLGRHFGTLGKYLPISYPMADKVDVTLYPVGILTSQVDGHTEFGGASGAAIIKFDVAF